MFRSWALIIILADVHVIAIVATDDESFWEKLRDIEFVPCMEVRQEVEYDKRTFYRFGELADYWDFELLWSQAPIMEETLSPPYHLKRKLKMVSTLYSRDIDYVVRHLHFMIRIFSNARIYVAGRNFAEKRRSERVLNGFRDVYRYLDRCCGESEKVRKLIAEKLGRDRPWIYHLVPLPGETEVEASNSTRLPSVQFSEFRQAEEDRYKLMHFIAPAQIFFDVEQEVPSLMYRVPSWIAHGHDFLLDAFDVEEIPSIECSLLTLQHIRDARSSQPLEPEALSHVIMLLGLLHTQACRTKHSSNQVPAKQLRSDIRRQVWLPDSRGALRRPDELFVFDTPWLKARLALTKPNTGAHALLRSKCSPVSS